MSQVEPLKRESPAQDRAGRVLIVDDENGVRDLMTRWLEAGGYAVTTASNAEEALVHLEASPSAVALCDIRMPGHDGLWLAERIRRRHPETAVIMATAVPDVGPGSNSLGDGVIDYLTKPFGRDRLREAVQRGLDWHRAAWDARRWRQTLEQEIEIRRSRLSEAILALRIDTSEAVAATLSMLMLSDREAFAHAYRVADLSVDIGQVLGCSEDDLNVIHRGGLLHDLGKLAMPEAILRKPAPLSADEQALVQLYPSIGGDIIAQVPYLASAAPLVRDAQERMDGLGYPRAVACAGVCLGARIISVADAHDTMIRPRVFRDAIPPLEAGLELERCSGTQFDPAVVFAFRKLIDF
jgi:cyclic di-GMP phosphodiesterase